MQPSITFTGVDEQTNMDWVSKLRAEIGFLYTKNPDGRNRYPSREWITTNAPKCHYAALHICGGKARQELLNGELTDFLKPFRRMQVNGKLTVEEVEKICEMNPNHVVITQHNSGNIDLLNVKGTSHALLVDASGGKGLSPVGWVRPETYKSVGFVGGFCADNIPTELPKVQIAAGQRSFWIDMEGKLRDDNDWFDISKVNAAYDVFEKINPPIYRKLTLKPEWIDYRKMIILTHHMFKTKIGSHITKCNSCGSNWDDSDEQIMQIALDRATGLGLTHILPTIEVYKCGENGARIHVSGIRILVPVITKEENENN
jgi:hypothetical protein